VSIGAVYGAYQIIHNHATLDLSGWIHGLIIENLGQVKRDHDKHILKFGATLVCIFFYFIREFPGYQPFTWSKEQAVIAQISQVYNKLEGKGNATI